MNRVSNKEFVASFTTNGWQIEVDVRPLTDGKPVHSIFTIESMSQESDNDAIYEIDDTEKGGKYNGTLTRWGIPGKYRVTVTSELPIGSCTLRVSGSEETEITPS